MCKNRGRVLPDPAVKLGSQQRCHLELVNDGVSYSFSQRRGVWCGVIGIKRKDLPLAHRPKSLQTKFHHKGLNSQQLKTSRETNYIGSLSMKINKVKYKYVSEINHTFKAYVNGTTAVINILYYTLQHYQKSGFLQHHSCKLLFVLYVEVAQALEYSST